MTTSIAFDKGFVEGNPILSGMSIGQIAVLKLGITQAIKFTPMPICKNGLFGLTTVGYGAALWNLGVIVGSGPASIPFIIGLIWWQWDDWLISSTKTCEDPWHFEPITFFGERTGQARRLRLESGWNPNTVWISNIPALRQY